MIILSLDVMILSFEGRGYGDLGAQRLSRTWRGWSLEVDTPDTTLSPLSFAESPSPLQGEG